MKAMRHILYILLVLLLAAPTPVMEAQQRKASTEMTAAQRKRAKEKAKRDKAKAKAQAKREKEKAKVAAAKQKASDQRAAEKQKELDKKAAAREKEDLKKAGGDRQLAAKTKEAADRIAKRTSYHHLAIWGGAGYSGLLGKTEATGLDSKFVGGGGGLIGIGYQLQHQKFIFKIGPEFRLFSSLTKFSYAPDQFKYTDEQYPSMDRYYKVDGMKQNNVVGQIMLPVLFGASFEKVYFLVGAKFGYTLLHNYSQSGTMTTSVYESTAFDPSWTNMLNHYQTSSSLDAHPLYGGGASGKFDMGLDVALSAEIGINLNAFLSDEWNSRNEERRFPWRLRIAAFVDYGMPLTAIGGGDNSVVSVNAVKGKAGDNTTYQTTNVYSSDIAKTKMSSLLVGVKFTALLQLNKPKMPDPFICFMVTDTLGRTTRSAATVAVSQASQPNRKAKIRKMNKEGKLDVRYPKDTYRMLAQAAGYLPSNYAGDTLVLNHVYDGDSAIFRLIPVPALVTYVADKETGQRLSAKVEYISLSDEAHNARGQVDGDKPHHISLHYGDQYLVRVSAPNYHPDSTTIANLTDTINLTMRPIHRLRHKLVLKNMYFAVDRTEILPGSEKDIETLYYFLVDNPRIRVMITGHTDSDGTEEHNQVLSEGRAASLKNEMIGRGIDPARIETEGKGESEPIDTNETEAGKANNRRIEVTVLNAEEAEEDVW